VPFVLCVRNGSDGAEKWTSVSPCRMGALASSGSFSRARVTDALAGRGLHSSRFRLIVSAFCVIGDAFSSCLRGVWLVTGVIRVIFRVYVVSETAQDDLKSGRV